MPLFLPIIAIIILGVAEVSMNITPPPTPTPKESTYEKEEKPSPTKSETTDAHSSIKIMITTSPTKKVEEKPTPSNYIYPGSTVSQQSGSQTSLETGDFPQQVTDWYKNYIQGNGMNTTSFVTTNTNNNVLNRLVGAGNGQKIDIEIKRNEGENTTKIKIIF